MIKGNTKSFFSGAQAVNLFKFLLFSPRSSVGDKATEKKILQRAPTHLNIFRGCSYRYLRDILYFLGFLPVSKNNFLLPFFSRFVLKSHKTATYISISCVCENYMKITSRVSAFMAPKHFILHYIIFQINF